MSSYGILDILDIQDIYRAFRERTSWTRSRCPDADSGQYTDLEELTADLRINLPHEHHYANISLAARRAHVLLQAAMRCAVNDVERNILPLPAVICDGGDFPGPATCVRTGRERLAHL